MKKKLALLLALVLTVSLCTGCRASGENESADAPVVETAETKAPETTPAEPETTEPAPATEPEAEEDVMEGDAATHYINEVYAEQIQRYHVALSEQWDEGKYYENEMCAMASAYYEGNALDNVGFAFADMDSDGDWELIIGAIHNSDMDPAIFEIWTLDDNGEPVMLVQSGYRNRYFVEYSSEDDAWFIANEGSNSAANSGWHYFYLENNTMQVMQAVIFDAIANEENPWFMAYDYDWDVSNDEPIDEETAMSIIDAHCAQYTVPEYFPYSLY